MNAAELQKSLVDEYQRTREPRMFVNIKLIGETDIPAAFLASKRIGLCETIIGDVVLDGVNVGHEGRLWSYASGEGLRPYLDGGLTLTIDLSKLVVNETVKEPELPPAEPVASDEPIDPPILSPYLILIAPIVLLCALAWKACQ